MNFSVKLEMCIQSTTAYSQLHLFTDFFRAYLTLFTNYLHFIFSTKYIVYDKKLIYSFWNINLNIAKYKYNFFFLKM